MLLHFANINGVKKILKYNINRSTTEGLHNTISPLGGYTDLFYIEAFLDTRIGMHYTHSRTNIYT